MFKRLLFVAALLLWPGMVLAQEVALVGTVTDTTKGVLPGVTVTAVHIDSGNTFTAVTDASGTYTLNGLRTGLYTIRVELSGFSTVKQDNLPLQVGQRAALNFSLALSSLQETVTVTGAAPLVDFTQSRVAGVIDQRQVQDLPLNGRNWMELTLLAPGSRANAVSDSPVAGNASAGSFQLNVDGVQVSNTMACARWGQPKFSRDAIDQFEMVTSRWDATQGRSTQVQVNVVTKAGGNLFTGTSAAYFRHTKLNAPDFITKNALPYSNQQVSTTYGGPIIKDRLHFFGYYDAERNPSTPLYTSAYPRFNAVLNDTLLTMTDHKWGGRTDYQLSSSTRLMFRANGSSLQNPASAANGAIGGATTHPSRATTSTRSNIGVMGSLSQVLSSRSLNEIRVGYSDNTSKDFSRVESPSITLAGFTIGNVAFQPLYLTARTLSVRDDFSTHRGKHSIRIGGDFLRNQNIIYWPSNKFGTLVANAGGANGLANRQVALGSTLEDWFPVWNDPTTWKLDNLNPLVSQYSQGIPAPGTNFEIVHPNYNIATWLQDDWEIVPRLTLNLGIRWDLLLNNVGEEIDFQPFRGTRGHEWKDVAPRLGFAYELSPRTVIRGGWGMYYQGVTDQPTHHSMIDKIDFGVTVFNDGRPDFSSNPFNLGKGVAPTYAQALTMPGARTTNGVILSKSFQVPLTYQTTVGVQQQIGRDMSIKADYVLAQDRHSLTARNINLSYRPATGVAYPTSDVTKRVYSDWAGVNMRFAQGIQDYRALEMAFTKRMSHRWQASVTYTLAFQYTADVPPINDGCQYPMTAPGVCDVPVTLAPFLYEPSLYLTGAQRHRGVINGIWDAPYGIQLSGLFFYSNGGRGTTTSGLDPLGLGVTTNRLRADGSLIPRNNFNNDDTRRTDLRLQRHFNLARGMGFDIFLEAFNAFNYRTNSYTLNESSISFGAISGSNQPRSGQIGFRLSY